MKKRIAYVLLVVITFVPLTIAVVWLHSIPRVNVGSALGAVFVDNEMNALGGFSEDYLVPGTVKLRQEESPETFEIEAKFRDGADIIQIATNTVGIYYKHEVYPTKVIATEKDRIVTIIVKGLPKKTIEKMILIINQ